jgi:hypothetical protein
MSDFMWIWTKVTLVTSNMTINVFRTIMLP